VHVVYRTATQNISTAQVQSQIDVLNEDFRRRTNSNASATLSQFQGLAADTEIAFCLANQDPQGNPHSGITRTSTLISSFSNNDNVKFAATGGHDAWPASQYLNIWVCDLGGGLFGYAQFPGGPANTDGVVNDYAYFGRIGTATYPFHLGRTCTHEVGHYLNLRHIWGDGGCGVDDLVADTPLSDAANYGCPLSHSSCGSLDMVQNYMDYTDDSCMNIFTAGQKSRMRAQFSPGGYHASLLNSPACGPTQPTLPEWQVNQIFSSINFDGTTGTQYQAAVTTKCVGDPGTFTVFSLGGGLFNVGFMVRALYPRSAPQSIETTGGQTFHIDMGHPSTRYWAGGLIPTVIPYIGNQTLPYTATAAVQYSAQMLMMNPTHVDGYYLSAGGQLDIGAGSGTPTALTLGDDDNVSFSSSSPVSFYGTTTSTIHANSNGSVSLNGGSNDFTATTGEFLSGPPMIAGHWSDLNPTIGGTVEWSEACGNTVVSFLNLPEWGVTNPPTASFDVVFWGNGNVSIDNRSVGPGWTTQTVPGFSPGGGASGTSVTFSSLIGGSSTYTSGYAIYEFSSSGTTSAFSSATLTPGNALTVN
ncbi:MAG: zinc metalloprotease, partial [Planctomycetes bacterium]|nr:zinc metalloprotease [Planctomycetota bacterium]